MEIASTGIHTWNRNKYWYRNRYKISGDPAGIGGLVYSEESEVNSI